jgi:hypothetical protein
MGQLLQFPDRRPLAWQAAAPDDHCGGLSAERVEGEFWGEIVDQGPVVVAAEPRKACLRLLD